MPTDHSREVRIRGTNECGGRADAASHTWSLFETVRLRAGNAVLAGRALAHLPLPDTNNSPNSFPISLSKWESSFKIGVDAC